MQIVYIANTYPYPPISGHRIRNFNLLKRLGEKHQLHLFLLLTELPTIEEINALGVYCQSIRCFYLREVGALDRPLLALKYLIRSIPPDFRAYDCRVMKDVLREFFQDHQVDILQIEDPCMALYQQVIPRSIPVVRVLTFHDINFRKFERISSLEKSLKRGLRLKLHSKLLKIWEPHYAENFDLCVTMSGLDANLFKELNPRINTLCIPNAVDSRGLHFRRREKRNHHLIFVGNMGYRPNIDAVIYFTKDIFPTLLEKYPDLVFYIVGIDPDNEVKALASEHITVTGPVDSVDVWYAHCDVSVVPLRAGGGTRLKILESMALGCPVVSTTVGAEGLDLIDGVHLLLADSPESMIEKIIDLFENEQMYIQLIEAARKQVEQYYDWDAIAQQLEACYLEQDEKKKHDEHPAQ